MAASFGAYRLPLERDGKKDIKLAYNWWSGEYPGPVIDVTRKTTIQAHASVRKLGKTQSCTVKEGLYHPWSQDSTSLINYYTLVDLTIYEAEKDTALEEAFTVKEDKPVVLKKGDQVTNEVYLSEGWCRAEVRTEKSKYLIEYFCDAVLALKNRSPKSPFSVDEQWIYVRCEEGHKAFMQDIDFLNSPDVREGQILGYGEVGPGR